MFQFLKDVGGSSEKLKERRKEKRRMIVAKQKCAITRQDRGNIFYIAQGKLAIVDLRQLIYIYFFFIGPECSPTNKMAVRS